MMKHYSCGYCDIGYDVIGKMETFVADLRYIVTKANLTDRINVNELSSVRSNKSGGKESPAKSGITQRYMDLLDDETQSSLVKAYDLDYRMFGYDPEKYVRSSR